MGEAFGFTPNLLAKEHRTKSSNFRLKEMENKNQKDRSQHHKQKLNVAFKPRKKKMLKTTSVFFFFFYPRALFRKNLSLFAIPLSPERRNAPPLSRKTNVLEIGFSVRDSGAFFFVSPSGAELTLGTLQAREQTELCEHRPTVPSSHTANLQLLC